ncbi:hypothetical protein B0J15DRAFT_164947 [Fusarium solani]|uniref:Uncharacterized protein n=1 Tax=Fusarium solani TaxID=169388 RepID=A0A9P9L106_FUSSL|nr:uncharacterized protein B0J15DRAFT_164947 [Fusarium solani]KAH7272014.1 hypothetical protein B0J15DRAFT_164947 [Fusarium solani]
MARTHEPTPPITWSNRRKFRGLDFGATGPGRSFLLTRARRGLGSTALPFIAEGPVMDVLLVVLVVARILPAPMPFFFNVFFCSSSFFYLGRDSSILPLFLGNKKKRDGNDSVCVCMCVSGRQRKGGAHRLIRYVKRTKAKAVLFVVEFSGGGRGVLLVNCCNEKKNKRGQICSLSHGTRASSI